MSRKLLLVAALVALAIPAFVRSQSAPLQAAPQAGAPAPSPPPAQQAYAPGGPTLADACLALLDGRVPANVDPVSIRPRCAALVRAGVSEQASVSRSGVQQGESVRTGITQAPRELAAPAPAGPMSFGGVSNTITTNPIGWFSGLGVNVEYRRPFDLDRFSYVIQGRYARASASSGNVSTFGTGGGADVYLIGGRNAGLRLGPRVALAFGRESVQRTSTFARLGVAGEIGYDYIASNGFTGSVAGGFGGRLLGDTGSENFASYTSGETGPYLTLGLGYSW